MEIKGKVHCFFEQSGTFKNEFIKLGIPAEDYDIQNNFGQTDNVVDLFKAIEDAYDGRPSLFDRVGGEDLIVAFFPCIYFSANNSYLFDGTWQTYKQQGKTEEEINEIILQRSRDRQYFYEIALKMFATAAKRGVRLIVENPYSTIHYLHNNFPYKAQVIDKDRRTRGDWFAKPTQYWFVNCEPTHGLTEFRRKDTKNVAALSGREERSLIAPEYARNFICDFILGREQIGTQMTIF